MGGPGRPYCLGQVCEGHLLRSWSWGTAPAPTQSLRPQGLVQVDWDPALCQHPGGKSSPCPWDGPGDLGQADPAQRYSGALSLGPRTLGLTGQQETIWWQMDRPQ